MASITDELRKEARGFGRYVYTTPQADCLTAIADRIDEAHEVLRDQLDTSERQKESYREDLLAANKRVHASYNDGFDDGFARADDWYVEHEAELEKHGFIKLPTDADGEVIHIGDVMESKDCRLLFGKDSFEVRSMRCDECGWEVYDRLGDRYAPSLLRHHHAPTVEDVLREMLDAWGELPAEATNEAIVAEYAAKLQLADDYTENIGEK